jgi:hypothetical protein
VCFGWKLRLKLTTWLDDDSDGSDGCDGNVYAKADGESITREVWVWLLNIRVQESMGDEMKQEIEDKKHQMLGVGAPGLPRDLDVGPAREALAGGGGKSGKAGRRKK